MSFPIRIGSGFRCLFSIFISQDELAVLDRELLAVRFHILMLKWGVVLDFDARMGCDFRF